MRKVKTADMDERFESLVLMVNEIVEKFLPEAEGPATGLLESLNYSVRNGGKRVRPMLLLFSFKALGGDTSGEKLLAEPFAAALEYIHSYSLVHDDLPEMDDDMYRRGKLTTHAKYGQAAAVLAGDGLLNYAYEVMAKAVMRCGEDSENSGLMMRGIKALSCIAKKAGIYGMVGGQSVDVEMTGSPMSADQLAFVYKNKTAALIEAALMTGAILAGCGSETVEMMERVGRNIGLAFQVRDDILDEISTDEVLGKPIHSDADNNKTTYVTLRGIDTAQAEVERLTDSALETLDEVLSRSNGGSRAEEFGTLLIELLTSLVEREK